MLMSQRPDASADRQLGFVVWWRELSTWFNQSGVPIGQDSGITKAPETPTSNVKNEDGTSGRKRSTATCTARLRRGMWIAWSAHSRQPLRQPNMKQPWMWTSHEKFQLSMQVPGAHSTNGRRKLHGSWNASVRSSTETNGLQNKKKMKFTC